MALKALRNNRYICVVPYISIMKPSIVNLKIALFFLLGAVCAGLLIYLLKL
jgi:hypothetical protein